MSQDSAKAPQGDDKRHHTGHLIVDLAVYYRYYPTCWGQAPNLSHVDDEGPWWFWSCCDQPRDVVECVLDEETS